MESYPSNTILLEVLSPITALFLNTSAQELSKTVSFADTLIGTLFSWVAIVGLASPLIE